MKKSGKFKVVPCLAIAAVCIIAIAVTSAYSQVIVYGTERGGDKKGDIYEINLVTKTATFVFETGLNTSNQNSPNGNAFDAMNNRLYYSSNDREDTASRLYFYDFVAGPPQTDAGTLYGFVAGATFYDGKYWYIENRTDDLRAVSFNANGTVASDDLVKADFSSSTKIFRFGDIVVSYEGVIYGSAQVIQGSVITIEFFSMDLDGSNYYVITSKTSGGTRQLAFGLDGKLYSHNAGTLTHEFFTIDPLTGTETSIGSVFGSSTGQFTDLASGPRLGVDIKPQSCPNPLNVQSRGLITVAILGTGNFDVSKIDPASVQLEGVSPLRWAWEDVATPFIPLTRKENCFEDCTTEGPDGYLDFVLKFDTQEMVAALGDVNDGDCLVLELTGTLFDSTPIVGEDVVVIRKKGNK